MTTPAKPETNISDREIFSSRWFDFPVELVFNAVADPKQLPHWWGPNGFSSVIHSFEFKPNGVWIMDMIGPDGTKYPNRSIFLEIIPNQRSVFQHDSVPYFTMTMIFESKDGGTLLTWRQLFDSASVRDQVAKYAVPANEQNFDRLNNHLKGIV